MGDILVSDLDNLFNETALAWEFDKSTTGKEYAGHTVCRYTPRQSSVCWYLSVRSGICSGWRKYIAKVQLTIEDLAEVDVVVDLVCIQVWNFDNGVECGISNSSSSTSARFLGGTAGSARSVKDKKLWSSRIHVVVFMRKVNPQFFMVKQVDHHPQ
ncbi:hypothetical protein F2Q70_00026933 [Brassica cretica]|uniref:Uncharacterized protein n=1 Tax=Brassica cretica TaxID=69181 RepID=A0A8S9LBU1_BRACR|nr:hypothetical protein F2Q70_00026933 [Brassica cretica]